MAKYQFKFKPITEINLGVHFPNSFAASASFAVKFWRMPK